MPHYSTSEERLEAFKRFIQECTASPNSITNYTQFSVINELIQNNIDKEFESIIDVEEPEVLENLLNRLCEFNEFPGVSKANQNKNFKKIGNYQYYNAFLTYIKFLKAIKIFDSEQVNHKSSSICSLQQIYFGAPGTGKSFAVNAQVGGKNNPNVVRTTFHPDSDYSTFVGAYKPTMNRVKEQLLSLDELVSRLANLKANGGNYCSQKFGAKYWFSLKQLSRSEKKDILAKCELSENFIVEVDKGIAVGEEAHQASGESQIGYSFVPQAFLNAYTMAYKKPNEKVFLVIEEINRGNCAQIFGDIFQLLDRGADGVSTYENTPDVDLQRYLSEKFADCEIADADIKSGAKMKLPSNLSIIATMNTSDQSLFPIDSAFKRRWDWKYIPINKTEEGHYIECGGEKYDWWNFLEKVNPRIEQTTGSEDKQLGFWFAKPDTGEDNLGISADKFVSKVVFYLWNDVFKDYASDANNVFKTEDRLLKFREFFDKDGNVDLTVLRNFLQALDIEHQASSSEDDKDTASEPNE